MRFGISNSCKSQVVQKCTPEEFCKAVDSSRTREICAELVDVLESYKRGKLTKLEYDEKKAELKKRLPVLTPHATFKNGRRKSDEAIPSGLSMYDVDHLPNPRGYWEMKSKELRRKHTSALESIVLVHITPSTEGLRLLFVVPQGMSLEEAQRWMSHELGDANYDGCVKDLARCSFVVPREYILFMDEERLFASSVESSYLVESGELRVESSSSAQNSPLSTFNSPLTFKGIPYKDIIAEWFRQSGGEPCQGERNDKLHRLASHLRYITDNDEALLLQIMPNYGLREEEMKQLIHSACTAKFYSMPKRLQEVLQVVESYSVERGEFVGA